MHWSQWVWQIQQRWMVFLLSMVLLTGVAGASPYSYQALTSPLWQSGCVDIPAVPDYLATGSSYDAIAAINNAHMLEGLPPLDLPLNFYRLGAAQQQFIVVNLEREARGLSPLHLDANLAQLALNYSRQMRDLHFYSHTSPIGGTFSERIAANPALAGHYRLVAENLAGNPVPGVGPIYEYMYDDVAEGCSHRANILDPALTTVGIGAVAGSPYGCVSVQEFLASAPWNPYRGALPVTQPPRLRLLVARNSAHPWLLQVRALARVSTGTARITWFLDHIGGKGPLLASGSFLSLDLRSLAPGRHTLLVYVVDGEQNYSMAAYTIG
jgi:uncharacterized protein YkwD